MEKTRQRWRQGRLSTREQTVGTGGRKWDTRLDQMMVVAGCHARKSGFNHVGNRVFEDFQEAICHIQDL